MVYLVMMQKARIGYVRQLKVDNLSKNIFLNGNHTRQAVQRQEPNPY